MSPFWLFLLFFAENYQPSASRLPQKSGVFCGVTNKNFSERLAAQPLLIVQCNRLHHSKAPAPPANLETRLISSWLYDNTLFSFYQ
jgi:hypothetical protein